MDLKVLLDLSLSVKKSGLTTDHLLVIFITAIFSNLEENI